MKYVDRRLWSCFCSCLSVTPLFPACLWRVWQVTTSMVRLVFSKPQKTLKDVYFDADKQSIA